jgi:hypothetical protein
LASGLLISSNGQITINSRQLIEEKKMDLSLFQNPWVLVPVLIMPVVIIALAKSWKNYKDKAAASKQA